MPDKDMYKSIFRRAKDAQSKLNDALDEVTSLADMARMHMEDEDDDGEEKKGRSKEAMLLIGNLKKRKK